MSVLKYLPWNILSEYFVRKEYNRYREWLKKNYVRPLRETRADHQIIVIGCDFQTNRPVLKRIITPNVRNPYKI